MLRRDVGCRALVGVPDLNGWTIRESFRQELWRDRGPRHAAVGGSNPALGYFD